MIDPLLVPTILSIGLNGIIGIISQIQHSRCSEIRGCGFACKREVPKEQPNNPVELQEVEARMVQ